MNPPPTPTLVPLLLAGLAMTLWPLLALRPLPPVPAHGLEKLSTEPDGSVIYRDTITGALIKTRVHSTTTEPLQ